ncbi:MULTISPECIES: Uma2 family endonuclease [unclassified Sphaerospermopsis]|uniref:Uma2 family endonuclease n=1 Tax=unclassified Sphaerospermopsis TaxID=2646443 RepID=UPI001681B6D4|nr:MULTISPECIES: Uma2 family endonuclease [unclassified Sphaerospermopsis]MBD2132071.1 Uma2 family endonuclease [Sphaerospermopsis sp. FACHB-1094]MBD2144523.1 Uma2 family endonuclease [Sphaerospermopsis sp. FACHB-1194]
MKFSTLTNSLDNFLQQPNIEASPAWEFIQGKAQQKPMPTLFHSRLQRNLVNAINSQTTAYEAIQELRCIVPPMSFVPDIAVVKSERFTDEDGPLQASPDWLIEIRSPDQSTLDIQQKILHCLSNETELAWLIDIQRKQIWVWENQELPLIYADHDIIPSLDNILELTVANVMAMTQQR